MRLERYHEAHQAFREAVRLKPDNNDYHSGALEAALAEKREQTLGGRARKWVRSLRKSK